MATKLECKIGTGIVDMLRITHTLDGRSRTIIVQTAWQRRTKFNQIARQNHGFVKAMFAGRMSSDFQIGGR